MISCPLHLNMFSDSIKEIYYINEHGKVPAMWI
jgi:hypothetical protein